MKNGNEADVSPNSIRVELGDRGYDIVAGAGLIHEAGDRFAPLLEQSRVFIVTDSNVAPLWLGKLTDALDAVGITHGHVVLPAGETTKSFAHFETLCETILAARVERKTTLVALGGGVVGDLTGFAAASVLRGVPFIQVPTTLLAQVDSSVGGKTGINTKHGKNLVGAFYQPRLVLIDSNTLGTLPERELKAGYAEVVKYGLIDDPEFFDWLEHRGADLLSGSEAARIHAILTSCKAKARVVAEDERESGRRALLNLGHTFGHALEAECGYDGALLHGEAVAIGMVMAFDLSVRLGLCPPVDAERLRRHFDTLGILTDIRRLDTKGWTPDRLIRHMFGDKKVENGRITFVLARGIGKAFLSAEVPMEDLVSVLECHLAA